MANGRLAKDVQFLRRHVDALSDGQATVTEVDDNLESLDLDVVPKDGPYKGAKLQFKLFFIDYPDRVPQVVCLTRVYHPNIDPEDIDNACEECYSNICVSLLDEWDVSMTLDHVVLAILFLMYNPEVDDALSPHFGGGMTWEEFEENLHQALRGKQIDGQAYDCLIVDENGNPDDAMNVDETCDTNSAGTSDKETTGAVTNTYDDENVVNEADTLAKELLLNRQNSLAYGVAKDGSVDAMIPAVILHKVAFMSAGTVQDFAGYFGSKFISEFGSFVRTVPALNALFHGFQPQNKVLLVSFSRPLIDGIESEVD